MESPPDFKGKIYDNLADIELFGCFKAGERGAFAELFSRYYDLLYVHAYNK
jgi:RNA polymerase sigma-70 factor (ECF subfamily)